MKHVGLLLLVLGTALCAVFGARLPGMGDPVHDARLKADMHERMAPTTQRAFDAARERGDDAETARLARLHRLVAPGRPQQADGSPLPAPRGQDAVRTWFGDAGMPFLGGIVLVVLGVILARRGIRSEVQREAKSGGGVGSIGALVDGLADGAAQLAASPQTDAADVRHGIEALQHAWVEPLIEGRARIQDAHGVAGYASVFVPFSAAERQLYRAWSASVDGYPDEVQRSLQAAAASAAEAQQAWGQLKA